VGANGRWCTTDRLLDLQPKRLKMQQQSNCHDWIPPSELLSHHTWMIKKCTCDCGYLREWWCLALVGVRAFTSRRAVSDSLQAMTVVMTQCFSDPVPRIHLAVNHIIPGATTFSFSHPATRIYVKLQKRKNSRFIVIVIGDQCDCFSDILNLTSWCSAG